MKFTIYGNPVSKGRPRFARHGNFVKTYTDEKTASYENLVKLSFINDNPGYEIIKEDTQLKAIIKAYYSIPKSTTKKKLLEIEKGTERPLKKPDLDNIAKIILDSLNGLVYHDDKQIISLEINKYYSKQPRVEVEIKERIKSEV